MMPASQATRAEINTFLRGAVPNAADYLCGVCADHDDAGEPGNEGGEGVEGDGADGVGDAQLLLHEGPQKVVRRAAAARRRRTPTPTH